MAFPTIATPSPAYHRSAGFQAVYIRPSGELYQTLGAIKAGELKFPNYSDQDSMGRNKAHAVEFTATCRMMQTSLTELELLDTICAGTNAFLFKLSDAAAIPTIAAVTEGWVVIAAAQVGCKAGLIADGTPNEQRYIELKWQGSLKLADLSAAVKASIDDNEFESTTPGAGTLHAIGTYSATLNGGLPTPANIKPAGVSSVTIADTGGAAQTLGAVKNVKIGFDFIADQDSLRRFLPHAIDIAIDYEWMQSDAANLLNLYTMVDADIDLVITMADGLIFTLTNQVGIQTAYEVIGDYDKIKIVRFIHTGKVLKSSFDGIVSV